MNTHTYQNWKLCSKEHYYKNKPGVITKIIPGTWETKTGKLQDQCLFEQHYLFSAHPPPNPST